MLLKTFLHSNSNCFEKLYDVVTQTCRHITLDLIYMHDIKNKFNTTAKMQICHMFGDLHM